MKELDTKRNLCSECCYFYPECPATENDVIFGVCTGNSKNEMVDYTGELKCWEPKE